MSTAKLWIYRLIVMWIPESRLFPLKNFLLRWAGAKIGRNVRVYSSATIVGTGRLEIGDDVHIGSGVFISSVAPALVKIGSCIDIGPQTMILTGSHEINYSDNFADPLHGHVAGRGTEASVVIGDGTWLGARSLILPGVILADKTLVAAGAVVTKSVANPKSLVAGVPAVIKRTIS